MLDVAPDRLIGDQRPRILWVPPGAHSSAGREVVELAASVDLILDDWQQFTLDRGLAERDDGLWLALEVGELVSRQNGKGGELEALELAALYLFGMRLTLHSTHRFKTTLEHFRRLIARIANYDDLRKRVKRISHTHGEESIELLSGERLEFMARSTSSGRGFSGELLVLDEAQILADTSMEAMLPTLSARPFGTTQIWYMFTAPDADKVGPCEVIARLRRRAITGGDPGLVYLEWSIDPHTPECPIVCKDHDDPASPRSWAKANPALGIRISPEHVAREMAAMSAAGFARERLGVGNWPADDRSWEVIGEEEWAALEDPRSQLAGPLVVAADIPPDAAWGAIGVAGRRPDGLLHVEVVDHKPRTAWMVPRLLDLQEQHQVLAVVVDPTGPAAMLIGPLLAAGFQPLAPMAPAPAGSKVLLRPFAREVGAAYAQFVEAATDSKTLRQLGQPELNAALAGARKRPLGDASAWTRKGSGVDISPLVVVTNALWGFGMREHLPQTTEPQSYFWDPDAESEHVAVQT